MTELVCIKCPMSCKLIVKSFQDQIKIEGNNCVRGEHFARQESIEPKRIVTSLIKVLDGDKPVLPVKTNAPVLKENIKTILIKISKIEVNAPVNIGDIIFKDIDDGVDLVATSKTQKI